MTIENLKITGLASDRIATAVKNVLTAIEGVQTLKITPADESAMVAFDDQLTSQQELLAALSKVGLGSVSANQKELAQGSCCGGCCN